MISAFRIVFSHISIDMCLFESLWVNAHLVKRLSPQKMDFVTEAQILNKAVGVLMPLTKDMNPFLFRHSYR